MSKPWNPKELGCGIYCDPNDPSTFGVDKQNRVAWAGRIFCQGNMGHLEQPGPKHRPTFESIFKVSFYWMLKIGADYLGLNGICDRIGAVPYRTKKEAFEARKRYCNTYPSYWPKSSIKVVRVKVKS